MMYRDGGAELLLTHGCDYIVAHRLDRRRRGLALRRVESQGQVQPTLRFVASPVAVPGLVVVPSAKNGPVLASRPGQQGRHLPTARTARLDPRAQHARRPFAAGRRRAGLPVPRERHADLHGCQDGQGALHQADALRPPSGFARLCRRQDLSHGPRRHVTVVKPGKEFEMLATNALDEVDLVVAGDLRRPHLSVARSTRCTRSASSEKAAVRPVLGFCAGRCVTAERSGSQTPATEDVGLAGPAALCIRRRLGPLLRGSWALRCGRPRSPALRSSCSRLPGPGPWWSGSRRRRSSWPDTGPAACRLPRCNSRPPAMRISLVGLAKRNIASTFRQ